MLLRFSASLLAALVFGGLIPARPARAQATPLRLLPRLSTLLQNSGDEFPELVTDRPDFTESAVVVPMYSLQIENGFTFQRLPGGVNVYNLPETLLRYGVGPRTELRFALPNYINASGGGSSSSGLGSSQIGIKQQFLPRDSAVGFAIIPFVDLPDGTGAFSSHRMDPGVLATVSYDLSDLWSVATQATIAFPSGPGGRNRTVSPTLVFGYGVDERWGLFLEWAGDFPEHGGGAHLIHNGATYLLGPNEQLDFHYGFGLNGNSPDYLIGFGYSVRLN